MFSTLKNAHTKWESYKNNLKQTNRLKYRLVDTVEVIVVALAMALVIRHFVIQTSVIPSPSMVPTLMVEDRLFVNKFIYRFSPVQRGDIVVFDSPNGDGKDYVKRCVGLPGDNLRVIDGDIYINGKLLVFPGSTILQDQSNFGPVDVPQDSYFMMGDNRKNSYDSRFWGPNGLGGFVKKDHIKGKALFTFWPFSRMRPLH
jgi:signal peptidase I